MIGKQGRKMGRMITWEGLSHHVVNIIDSKTRVRKSKIDLIRGQERRTSGITLKFINIGEKS